MTVSGITVSGTPTTTPTIPENRSSRRKRIYSRGIGQRWTRFQTKFHAKDSIYRTGSGSIGSRSRCYRSRDVVCDKEQFSIQLLVLDRFVLWNVCENFPSFFPSKRKNLLAIRLIPSLETVASSCATLRPSRYAL